MTTAEPILTESVTSARQPESLDADRLADSATVDGLLRCWVREQDVRLPAGDVLDLELSTAGVTLRADIVYRSTTGHHRFDRVRMANGTPVTAVTVAALLAVEAAADPGEVTDLVARVADSGTRVARHLRERAVTPEASPGTSPFLAAEQALLLGHPLHPTPKSRIGWTESEAQRFSPELRGGFPLHWFAADSSIVSGDGAAYSLLAHWAPPVPEGMVPVPAHPWQAGEVCARPDVRHLLDSGLLHDVGPYGAPWYPTASIRTVYRPDAPMMLKFSLSLPITNSKRENLRKELRRGVHIDRLLDAGLMRRLTEAYPGFGIVRDPAWLGVGRPGGEQDTGQDQDIGLDLVVRANPFDTCERVACVAGLLAERPDRGSSELADIVTGLAATTGGSTVEVAEQWCLRYFDSVIAPVLWLYREHGLGLEAHQQNTVVALDRHGWPRGGWYRDNQGYYLSQRRVTELERFLPGVGEGVANTCDEAVIDERLGYYVGINNLFGLVGAFGSQGLADERRLLAALRGRLRGFADLPLARTLAEAPTLRCKANLLTRVGGMDELVGPLETQSVYRDIANPFVEVDPTA